MAQEIADSTLLDTWGSGGNIVEPDISKIIEGWQLGEQPPHEYMNWLQNTFGSKLNHILKNGVAQWESTKEYLAGATVQHTGNAWLCKATNTNSAPTDVNANWKRIITVESLATLLTGYVSTTGNETIAGVKTFSSSPIVPTPTTGTQAANKAYVDANAGEIITAGTGLQKSGTTLNFYPFGLTTATTELTTSDYIVVSDSTTPKKITIADLLNEMLNSTGSASYYGARAWVNFNGAGTVGIRASGNVSSITDNGVGEYTVNFTIAMPDSDYSLGYMCKPTLAQSISYSRNVSLKYNVSPTINNCRIITHTAGVGLEDYDIISLSIIR